MAPTTQSCKQLLGSGVRGTTVSPLIHPSSPSETRPLDDNKTHSSYNLVPCALLRSTKISASRWYSLFCPTHFSPRPFLGHLTLRRGVTLERPTRNARLPCRVPFRDHTFVRAPHTPQRPPPTPVPSHPPTCHSLHPWPNTPRRVRCRPSPKTESTPSPTTSLNFTRTQRLPLPPRTID